MRKLRTKSNIQTKSNILDDQPSTSNIQTRRHSTNSSDQHHSPESPINGRIAKNNAKILNGELKFWLLLNDEKISLIYL